jgi:acetyltransferase-like isoleucine patch superfamily enzyme
LSGDISLSGTDSENYTLTQPTGLTAGITPQTLILTGTSIANKIYDRSVTASVYDWGILNGIVSGDNVSIYTSGVTASFNNKNAGTGKSIILNGSISLSGTDAGNYTLTQPSGLTANITPKSLTLSGTSIANKTYNASVSATVSSWGTLSGVVSGDNVSIYTSGITASFNNKNVGSNKPVTLSGNISLSGTDYGNYTLTQPSGLQANITSKTITLTGVGISNKLYDGSTSAVIANWGTFDGLISGDNVGINQNASIASFNNKNVGNYKPVTFNAILSGTDVGNYTLTQPTGLTANITPKSLTLSGISISNKVYDRSVTASVYAWGTLNGLISGDNVSVNQNTSIASFNNKNVGDNKPVTFAGTLSGTDAGNYTLTQPTGLSANITPKPITFAGISIYDKIYDGSISANISNWGSLDGLIPGDNVSINQNETAAFFNNKNAGNNKDRKSVV